MRRAEEGVRRLARAREIPCDRQQIVGCVNAMLYEAKRVGRARG
jgi:hypothetical protein